MKEVRGGFWRVHGLPKEKKAQLGLKVKKWKASLSSCVGAQHLSPTLHSIPRDNRSGAFIQHTSHGGQGLIPQLGTMKLPVWG